ncbi:hypothetical protein RJT34_21564 [Clitoria ternatea]|uniref:Uncharacterized protein n=1 Tax=Clitoria ternatea TaxID=43366 RepID=A0AAN9IUC9_CLITE
MHTTATTRKDSETEGLGFSLLHETESDSVANSVVTFPSFAILQLHHLTIFPAHNTETDTHINTLLFHYSRERNLTQCQVAETQRALPVATIRRTQSRRSRVPVVSRSLVVVAFKFQPLS